MKTLKITTTSESEGQELEVHFNLWNSEKNKFLCLDIGIMANIEEKPYKIDLNIPGKYNTEKRPEDLVEDLGHVLIEKEKIASNIFNCKLHFDSGEAPRVYIKEPRKMKKKILLFCTSLQ